MYIVIATRKGIKIMFHILFLRLHHDNNVSSIDKWGVEEDMGGAAQNDKKRNSKFYGFTIIAY